jgi:hypothetical protein
MIIFEGIIPTTSVDLLLLRFRNENDVMIDIPVSRQIANLISLYLAKITTVKPKSVERGNDEQQ